MEEIRIYLAASQLRHLRWLNSRKVDYDIKFESSRSLAMLLFMYMFPLSVWVFSWLDDPNNFIAGGVFSFASATFCAYRHFKTFDKIEKRVDERSSLDISFIELHGLNLISSVGAIVFAIIMFRILKNLIG